jgi:hypothetical protein
MNILWFNDSLRNKNNNVFVLEEPNMDGARLWYLSTTLRIHPLKTVIMKIKILEYENTTGKSFFINKLAEGVS